MQKLIQNNYNDISLELIQYQVKDSFIHKAEAVIDKIRKEIENGIFLNNTDLIEKSSYVKELITLIRNRFNINIVLDSKLHTLVPFAIIPYFNDYLGEYNSLKKLGSNIFSKLFKFEDIIKHIEAIDKEKKKILQNLHNKKGYIDFKYAKVGGYLSEIKHYLIIDFFSAIKDLKFSNKELLAVILHEIGHAFTGLEYHHKLEKVNTVISDIIQEINKNNTDKAIFIFKSHFKDEEFKNITISNKKEIYDFYGKLAIAYLKEINTQMVNAKYDETNFELLADSFAGRFGLYKELVSSLHIIHKRYNILVDNNLTNYSILFLLDLLLGLLSLALLGPAAIILSAFLILTVYNSNSELNVMVYDLPLDRYNRIKNNLINQIKNIELPKELLQDLYDQYVFITETIEKSLYYKTILERIADNILLGNKEAKYYIELQKQIENNLNNILFIKAVEVKLS